MRRIASVSTLAALWLALPTMASAHLGHFGALAGHDHWVAGAAIGAAAVVAAWGILGGRKGGKAREDAAAEGGETGTEADAGPEAEAEGA